MAILFRTRGVRGHSVNGYSTDNQTWSVFVLKHYLIRQRFATGGFRTLFFSLNQQKSPIVLHCWVGAEVCSGQAARGSRLWQTFHHIRSIWEQLTRLRWIGLDFHRTTYGKAVIYSLCWICRYLSWGFECMKDIYKRPSSPGNDAGSC